MPSNADRYLLPLWQRLLLRSCYVAALTLVGSIMPFFLPIVGLASPRFVLDFTLYLLSFYPDTYLSAVALLSVQVGSLTWWPLCVFFPILCWVRAFRPCRRWLALMSATAGFTALVSLAALVASVEALISSWASFKFFSSG